MNTFFSNNSNIFLLVVTWEKEKVKTGTQPWSIVPRCSSIFFININFEYILSVVAIYSCIIIFITDIFFDLYLPNLYKIVVCSDKIFKHNEFSVVKISQNLKASDSTVSVMMLKWKTISFLFSDSSSRLKILKV